MFVRVRRTELGSGTYWLVPSDRRENVAVSWELACTKALCYFSFRSFRKTSVSSRAKRALENERGARERNLYTIALAVNKSPAVYILSPGLDGLWRENRGSVNRLYVGLTATEFKARWPNHQMSFEHESTLNDTELNKYLWQLKEFTIYNCMYYWEMFHMLSANGDFKLAQWTCIFLQTSKKVH